MSRVYLENIVKVFPPNPNPILKGINMEIRHGETVAVLGPSGCGKSTLLRVIAGLETPTSGNVYFDEEVVNSVKPGDRGIGIVFQNYALYPHYKGKGNLDFFFRLRKRSQEEIDERVKATAEILGVGFDELLNQKPGNLSGGQQQRVALGRCIIKEPRIFLLDEPMSNLDAKLREQTRRELKKLLRKFKVTTLYVTHDQIEAIMLGDRVAVMNSGELLQLAPYRELYANPRNMFVASFIGLPPMKFVDAEVDKASGGVRFNGFLIGLESSVMAKLNGLDKVKMGFRPEDVKAADEGLEADITIVENMASEGYKLAYLDISGFEMVLRTTLDSPVNAGDRIKVNFDAKKIYLFDPETEEAVVTPGQEA